MILLKNSLQKVFYSTDICRGLFKYVYLDCTVQVKLGPRPWYCRWERCDLQGVEDLGLPERFYQRAQELAQPWEKYDLMKKYRNTINDVDASNIMSEVQQNVKDTAKVRVRQRPESQRKSK